jgi:Protein of unknown function (DUF3575)
MRTRKMLMAMCICMAAISSVTAQSTLDEQSGGSPAPTKKTSENGEAKNKMNIVKVNLMALGLKNYSFQYERILTKKISIALGVRTMPSGSLPFQDLFADQLAEDDPDLAADVRALKVGNFAITPEIRFYLNRKGYGRGFYLAPYYRFAKFNSDELPITYTGDGGTDKTIKLKGDVTTHSGGLMIGAQWYLGKVVTLDWWIVGAHYGTSNGTLLGTPSSSLSANEQTEIKNTIESLELPLTKIKAEVSANNIKAIVDGPWAGVRAGLSIGIRF